MAANNSLFSVEGKVACVTGASSGLGRHAADVLASAGARVIGTARRIAALEEWREKIGDRAAIIQADFTEQKQLTELAHRISEPFGPPDILVHAAGLNLRQPADQVTRESWETTLAVNLSAPFFLSQACVPAMQRKGWGRIVNFASLQSFRAFPSGIAYGASKGGLAQLTRAMAEAWSGAGISINAIGPGFFPTEMTEPVFLDTERAKRNAEQTCVGRNGVLEDIDGPLLFLCSDAVRYITGQVLMLDGGFTAK